jgi:N-acetylornithine carbamoyltransferase
MRMKRRASAPRLTGKTVGMLFFRGSLRTRASFEIAVHQLGGETINLTAASDFWQLEEREGTVMDGVAPEHIKDAGLVLSRYVNALAIRPAPAGKSWSIDRQDGEIHAWAKNARVPVINMESALWHPLQALADLMTMREHLERGSKLKGKRLAVVWTHSPTPSSSSVTNSLLDAAVRQGMDVRVAHPPGYELDAEIVAAAQDSAAAHGARLETGLTPEQAVEGAHLVYARSWQSLEDYGNPTLAASRRSRLTRWCIDERLLALGDGAYLMHAMPVRRNLEVVDAVLDGPRNLMYEQAENRMYSQKALLALLLGD